MSYGEWQVYVANEVRDWLDALDTATHTRVVQAIDALPTPDLAWDARSSTRSTDHPSRISRS